MHPGGGFLLHCADRSAPRKGVGRMLNPQRTEAFGDFPPSGIGQSTVSRNARDRPRPHGGSIPDASSGSRPCTGFELDLPNEPIPWAGLARRAGAALVYAAMSTAIDSRDASAAVCAFSARTERTSCRKPPKRRVASRGRAAVRSSGL
jgi:hypothetical protein